MKYLLLALAVVTTSCATISKGSTADVRFNSSPAGADIYINGIDKGSTPSTLNLNRNNNYIVTFKKEGYEDVKLEVNKKFDSGTTLGGNLFSFWVLGVVVDVASGAAYSLTPADVQGNLEELQEAGLVGEVNKDEDSIHIMMLTKEEWDQVKSAE